MTGLPLPAPDRIRSARTGWTRDHWLAVADHLLDALRPWVSSTGARIDLPGRSSWSGLACDGLEAYARSFLLAAFRIAADRGEGCAELIDRYATGLVAGADPDGPEAWPRITPCSQQMVEAASIAIALHESRSWIWDTLDATDQQKVVDWLGGFVGSRTWDNNWHLFQVVAEQFLASVGADHSTADIERGLDRIEDWYRGDGWYSDGDGQNYDYYGNFVLHPYPIFWSRMAAVTPGADADGRLQNYRDRLQAFIGDAAQFVGADGAPVHFGRSLCYRMGMLAPFWAGALTGATPLSPGQTRRLCSGVLRHFAERGVPNEQGLLSLGWYDTHLPTTQSYSGPGSPYWASKGFLGLLIPEDDPVWTAAERPLPLDLDDHVQAMSIPGLLTQATRHDGIVRLLNHGSDHLPLPTEDGPEPAGDPHYDRLAYSSRTGPQVSPQADRTRVDNHLALVAPDGSSSQRGHIRRIAMGGPFASSWSVGEIAGVEGGPWRIETASLVREAWEIRCSLVDGDDDLRVRHGGYAVAGQHRPETHAHASDRPWALVRRPDGLASVMIGLHGYTTATTRSHVDANAFGPHSATPLLESPMTSGRPRVFVSVVVLTGDSVWPQAVADSIHVRVCGRRVELHFDDGTEAIIRLGPEAEGPRCIYRPTDGPEEVI